ncbi:RNA polymerase sigma factor [Sphingobacterium yanglingense]|uniref:RNA polymerase sigma-70 factor (ECF subfamily) n=1 Tax=Sphingobacterium yanglingense TaxID=1437280 RepID=A0A4V3DER7_9SPHI|nr:sigma-70 family RNA polymerase sigma factor [Sphingobacterium yanglingense]TDQ82820.1 RNA polymerase sigma-70 factor (ECF subfamily) [Sphingobacterium yanglingense]
MKLYNADLPPNEEDAVLLAQYLKGNNMEALGKLYSKHAEMVYYVCLRYFKEEEKSKDAVMQIFEELITKIKKQDIKSFPKWLYVVSKNFCLMDLRSKKGRIEFSVDEFVEFPIRMHQEESYSEKEEKLSSLEQCIEKLPEKQRVTVDLFFINEHCYKEVVEITGYSMNEVKSYIQNGKRNLKNCMDRADA